MSLVDWFTSHPKIVIPAVTVCIASVFVLAFESIRSSTTKVRPYRTSDKDIELLMIGMSATTYRLRDMIVKTTHVLEDEPEITQENLRAMRNEASVYLVLGNHCRIAECLYIGLLKDLIFLKYYPHGNPRNHIAKHPDVTLVDRKKWVRQIIEGLEVVHQKGVRHADIRLDQWLLDCEWNARLSDFNASGFDTNEALGLEGSKALGLEPPSHFMPRDPTEDSSVRSDLFALGSTLYELEAGSIPFADNDDDTITECFEAGIFPEVKDFLFGRVMLGCWRGEYNSATDVLYASDNACGH